MRQKPSAMSIAVERLYIFPPFAAFATSGPTPPSGPSQGPFAGQMRLTYQRNLWVG